MWFVAPIVMFVVCIFTIVKRVMNEMEYLAYQPTADKILQLRTYPPYAVVIIIVLALQALVLIVLYPTIRYCQKRCRSHSDDDLPYAVRFSYANGVGESQVALATNSSTATSLNTVSSSARISSFNSLSVPRNSNGSAISQPANSAYKPVFVKGK